MFVKIFREARYGLSKGIAEVASLTLGGGRGLCGSFQGYHLWTVCPIWVYETESGLKELWLINDKKSWSILGIPPTGRWNSLLSSDWRHIYCLGQLRLRPSFQAKCRTPKTELPSKLVTSEDIRLEDQGSDQDYPFWSTPGSFNWA